MDIKVSVILPVYNTGKYLRRCLNSIINQTLKELEIIIVNDGSTDDSLEILLEYEKIDSRIILINKKNEGVSKARNIGITLSKGEFLMFVDADDWISTDMIEKMYNMAISYEAQLVICAYTKEYENKSVKRFLNYSNIEFLDSRNIDKALYRKVVGPIDKEVGYPGDLDCLSVIWGRLYRRSNIIDNNVKFIDTEKVGSEDCLFNIMSLNFISKAVIINKPYYHYWKGNNNSLTSVYKSNLSDKWNNLYKSINDIIINNKKEYEFYKALNNRICLSTLGLVLNECLNKNNSIFKQVKNIKKDLNNPIIVAAFKDFKFKYMPIHWKIFYFINKKKMCFLSCCMGKTINRLRTFI